METKKIMARSMEKLGTALSGIKIDVEEMPYEPGALGSSIREGNKGIIMLPFANTFDTDNQDFRNTLLYGVFAHEMLHILLTDFDHAKKSSMNYPPNERRARHNIANIIEDQAIEFFASDILSSFLCGCLHDLIYWTHDKSPKLEEVAEDAYEQFIASLIMFGNIGVLKGNFTFDEARNCFYKCAPIILQVTEEPDPKERYRLSQEVFEISRPLWEEHEKNMLSNVSMDNLLKSFGVSNSRGTGDPIQSSGEGNQDSPESKRKREVVQIILESNPSNSLTGDDKGASVNIQSEVSESNEESEDSPGNGSDGVEANGLDGNAAKEKHSSGTGKEDDSDAQNGSKTPEYGSVEKSSSADQKEPENGKNNVLNEDEGEALRKRLQELNQSETTPFSISEEHIKAVLEVLSNQADLMKREEKAKAKKEEKNSTDVAVKSPYYGDFPYRVVKMRPVSKNDYNFALETLKSELVNFRSRIRKIMQGERGRKIYTTTGRLSITRISGQRITARIFEKTKAPGNKQDLAVEILIDQSGSMSSMFPWVQKTCILIQEAFSDYDVKFKVIGFSSDYDCNTYYDYGDGWKNNDISRRCLLSGSCPGSTFLGHAIRFAGELLRKRPERNKLLIVITDGEPYHEVYKSREDGIKDCRNAVMNLYRFADVIGIGIYSNDEEMKTFRDIFPKDCVSMSDTNMLIRELPKKIGKILKKY